MVEEEEYDSDVSDRTVLLTDYVDKPDKIVMKRRRLSNLLDKSHRSDEFEDENSAPDDSNVDRRTEVSPAKKKNKLDITLHVQKYLESNSKNNDAKNRGDLDFSQKHVPTDLEIKKSNISKRNSIDIDTEDQVINLDSDDETQNADNSQDHVRKRDETLARNDHINIAISPHKPAPITNRRATTGIIERNKIQLDSNTHVGSERGDGLDENRAWNLKSTTDSGNEKSAPIAKAFNNACENREIPEANIIQETSQLSFKKDTTDVSVGVIGKQKTNEVIDKQKAGSVQDDEGERKALDEFGSSRLHNEQGTSEICDKREANNTQHDPENRQHEAHDDQVSEVQSENKINETYDQLETNENQLKTHQAQNETRNILDKTADTVKGIETTSAANLVDAEDNDRILKFQVGFFTLVKEYLKDIFPESAMELHKLIQSLKINTRNGQVQTEVKYSCPKCSLVSNFSSRVLSNAENEENKENVDGTQKCGFCNGIRKLHTSYLKRFLGKKHSIGDKKEVVKLVSPGNVHAIETEQRRRSLADEIVINNSQTTSVKATDKEPTSFAAYGKQTSCISIVEYDEQVRNLTFDQDTHIIKDNKICVQNKLGHMHGEVSTAHAISNKRKCEEAHKETTEHKRVKHGTDDTNAQGVKNLTATVSQTNSQRYENERPDQVQITSQQNVSSHGTEKLNSSLESDPSNNTGLNSATNSEPCDKNTPEKSSNESINTIDRNTHEVCLKPAADADDLDKRGKLCSVEINQPIKEVTSENRFGKGRQVEVNGHDKGKEKHSNKTPTGSVPETDEANAKQISNSQKNYKDDEGVVKPLMDCFAKIKKSVKEKQSTPKKAQQENTTASQIRSRVRSDRNDSLDSLPTRDHRKIVKKYVCPICTCMYVYASKLLQHMKTSHNQNLTAVPENCDLFECPFCRTPLSNKNYNKHVKQYHIEKVDESGGVIENNDNNKNKSRNEDHGTGKNMILLNRNTESNKTSESGRSKNDCFTPDKQLVTDNATKKQIHSETKYLHLIKRIDKDEQEEIHGGKNEELGPGAVPTPATTKKITSNDPANSTASVHVNITEWCCDESDRSPGLKSDTRQNTSSNEEERSPLDCNDEKIDSIEDVSSIRKDNMHDISETCHGDNNYTESDKTKTLQSYTSQETRNNRKDDKDRSSRKVGNDEYNDSEFSNSHGIDKHISLTTSCTVKNGKQNNNEPFVQYKNSGKQSTENTVMSVRGEEQETDNEEDCIKASDYTLKKRKERTTKVFGDESEVSVSNKIKNSTTRIDKSQKERQLHRNTKTKRPTSNRKADVHRRRGITVEKVTENAESSDSDWIIGDDENSDSHDDTFCTIKKQQVVRTLFSDENVQNLRNEECRNHKDGDSQSTKTDDSNNGSDDDTIKSSKHAGKKKKERLSELFDGDDEQDDRQAGNEQNGHRNDRQCEESEEGDKEHAPSICDQEIPGDDETLKVSKHMVKKKRERISKHFSYDEALEQNNDHNKQMEKSDINNADGRVPMVQDIRTTNVHFSECIVKINRLDISDYGTNYENSLNTNGHQGTISKERATIRKDTTAAAEEINMNAVNSENNSRDDDQIEINMIDRLLNELASDDQQSGKSSEKVNGDNVRKSEVSSESQATSEAAIDKSCLENIRITNVMSVESKTHVFICQECYYGTEAYDNAIRHCQNHYNSIEDQVTYCDICQINYETICSQRHQASHDKFLGNIKIKFSYMWLFTNWQMVFENNDISLSEAEDMQVKSIFKTFCVKMTVKENGPWQSAVYMCAKCNTCVPPLNVEQHVQEKCSFVNYPCRVCDLLFSTHELRKHHEIYHTDDASKPFKTIVFNSHNEDSFNSKLIQVKAQSKEKQGTVDIFKCLCGLCFNSLKKFKLHFADCDSELNDGRQCPKCTGIQRFSNTELEEHLLLHQSLFNYEFRVQRIMFQQESIIDTSEREAPSATSYGTDTTQITYNDEDLNIKTDLLKDESLTQNADGEDVQENMSNVEDENISRLQINETFLETSDSTTDDVAQVRSNDEDLIIKDELLKDESLTQNTNEVDSQEIPDSEKEATNGDVQEESSQEIMEIEESEHVVDTKASQDVMEVEESDDPITIKSSQEMEVVASEKLITIEDSDDDDVEITGESFPNLTQIFPLRFRLFSERYKKQSGQ